MRGPVLRGFDSQMVQIQGAVAREHLHLRRPAKILRFDANGKVVLPERRELELLHDAGVPAFRIADERRTVVRPNRLVFPVPLFQIGEVAALEPDWRFRLQGGDAVANYKERVAQGQSFDELRIVPKKVDELPD